MFFSRHRRRNSPVNNHFKISFFIIIFSSAAETARPPPQTAQPHSPAPTIYVEQCRENLLPESPAAYLLRGQREVHKQFPQTLRLQGPNQTKHHTISVVGVVVVVATVRVNIMEVGSVTCIR